jgi:hypothetical protein
MGFEAIQRTTCLWDILSRNLGAKQAAGLNAGEVCMTRADWKRRFGGF